MAQDLRQAVQDCRARALYASTKWAAAALCGLAEEEVMGSSQHPPATATAASSSSPAYELARSLFDVKVSRRYNVLQAWRGVCRDLQLADCRVQPSATRQPPDRCAPLYCTASAGVPQRSARSAGQP